jgi:hypothetical protein
LNLPWRIFFSRICLNPPFILPQTTN